MSERCNHADTVASFLLGALSDAERREFETHLATCARCREDVADLRLVTDALPLAVPPVAPPAPLRDRLFETVRAEAEVLRAAGPAADRPSPAPRRRFSFPFGRSFALAAGAAAAVVGIAVGFGVGSATNGGTTHTVVQVRTVQAAVSDPAAPRGAATVVESGGVATLQVRGLPLPPPGKVYEVWLVRRGVATPAPTDALFSVSHGGSGRVALPSVQNVTTVLVTAEPVGGSLAPTSRPFISASL